jgi:hypothetical protein
MAANLFTPILNDRTRSVHFFNGRLLTGEDMTAEQRGQRATHELLAQAIGDGIVRGLEVTIGEPRSLTAPVVKVTGGVAINRKGGTLLLPNDTLVQLVRTADAAPAARTLFTACTPPESGVYVAGAGVYLLTLCSTVAADGSASVSGLGGQPAGCNSRFAVDAVQFRLIELPMTDEEMQDVARLRNLVAYRCFGISSSFATDPFGATAEPPTLLDELRPRSLTDCDVPLATFYWTATGGLVWADMWSVRRRTAQRLGVDALSDRRIAIGEAMTYQFGEQIAPLFAADGGDSVVASTLFRFLPPIGVLSSWREDSSTRRGSRFFNGVTTRGPFHFEGTKAAALFRSAFQHAPIDLASGELIWLYRTRETMQRAVSAASSLPPLIFCTGHVEYVADAHYDLSHFNYANYARQDKG